MCRKQVWMATSIAFTYLVLGSHSHCNAQEKPAVMKIAGYDYTLPGWWDSVVVEVPMNLKSEDEVRKYVVDQYGMDVGTQETWKKALKTWAIASQRLEMLPVHVAHCHMTGAEYERAVKIYTGLYKVAGSQKQLREREWYQVFLAFKAGATYELLKDEGNAAKWYELYAKFIGSKDSAIDYYANQSAERLKLLKK